MGLNNIFKAVFNLSMFMILFSSLAALSETVLVVVDMQPKYWYGPKDPDALVVANVQAEVEKAMKKGQAIIFLEYNHYGSTDLRISALVKDNKYPRAYFATKYTDDGSLQVKQIFKEKNIQATKIKVCGINTAYCVLDTVKGLSPSFLDPIKFEIAVLSHACASYVRGGDWGEEGYGDASEEDHVHGLREMDKLEMVRIKNFKPKEKAPELEKATEQKKEVEK